MKKPLEVAEKKHDADSIGRSMLTANAPTEMGKARPGVCVDERHITRDEYQRELMAFLPPRGRWETPQHLISAEFQPRHLTMYPAFEMKRGALRPFSCYFLESRKGSHDALDACCKWVTWGAVEEYTQA